MLPMDSGAREASALPTDAGAGSASVVTADAAVASESESLEPGTFVPTDADRLLPRIKDLFSEADYGMSHVEVAGGGTRASSCLARANQASRFCHFA